jgi:anti-sigma factor RsiW
MALVVKGPLWAARRSADVAGLIGWEMARAVDQHTKTLDAADTERRRLEAGADALRRPSDSAGEATSPRAARQPALRSPKSIAPALPGGR